eukprot:scaffold63545_cov14-Tisochrysis_lutea.AAC.1
MATANGTPDPGRTLRPSRKDSNLRPTALKQQQMLFQCAPSHPPKALLQCITWWHAEDAGRWARKGSRYTGTYCTAGGSNCTAIIGTP